MQGTGWNVSVNKCNHVSAGNTLREGVQVGNQFGAFVLRVKRGRHASFSSLVLVLCRGTRRERSCMVVRGCRLGRQTAHLTNPYPGPSSGHTNSFVWSTLLREHCPHWDISDYPKLCISWSITLLMKVQRMDRTDLPWRSCKIQTLHLVALSYFLFLFPEVSFTISRWEIPVYVQSIKGTTTHRITLQHTRTNCNVHTKARVDH